MTKTIALRRDMPTATLEGEITEVVRRGAAIDIYIKTNSGNAAHQTMILSPRLFYRGVPKEVGTKVKLAYVATASYGLWFAIEEIKQ